MSQARSNLHFQTVIGAVDADIQPSPKRVTKASTSRDKEMEKETGITPEKWQNVAAKKQRVTEEMLEAIGRQWPKYSYWLMTGQTDYEHNHLDPDYEEWMNRHMRYSQSNQIILMRPLSAKH